MSTTELAYLFQAYFDDGSIFDQTPEDAARLEHPRKGTGSSFTDLLWLMGQPGAPKLRAFALADRSSAGVVAVYLEDGHFELCGNGFWAGAEWRGELPEGVERRLIYYRDVQQIASMDVKADTGESLGEWRYETKTVYYLGWQATIDGKNIQHVVGVEAPPAG